MRFNEIFFKKGVGPVQLMRKHGGKIHAYDLVPTVENAAAYTFRYVILHLIRAVSGSCLQFSHMEFIRSKFVDAAGHGVFDYSQCTPACTHAYGSFFNKETEINAVTKYDYSLTGGKYPKPSTNKVCCTVPSTGIYIYIDLGKECLNVKKFNGWRWRYSNDTNVETGRNMGAFALYVSRVQPNVSQNKDKWILLDSKQNQTYQTPYTDGAVAYTGTLDLTNIR